MDGKEVFKATYPAGVWPNAEIEIKATKDGLLFDEDFTIPWEWILESLKKQRGSGVSLSVNFKHDATNANM